MANREPQTYANHAKIVPPYHYGLTLLLLANLLWSAWRLIQEPSIDSTIALLTSFALIGLFWYTRIFPLAVQDRLIRLEMRLRLAEVLPEDLRGRINELSRGQFVALRFASDEELPDLVRQVLGGELTKGSEIKKSIKNWQADHLRC